MKEKIGIAIKYIPLILLLVISGISLFRNVVSGENGVSQSIRIWTNSISLVAIVGAIFSYYVFDLLAYRISGEKIDILNDFRRPKDKEKGSTTWNSALANLTLTNVAMLMVGLCTYEDTISLYLKSNHLCCHNCGYFCGCFCVISLQKKHNR